MMQHTFAAFPHIYLPKGLRRRVDVECGEALYHSGGMLPLAKAPEAAQNCLPRSKRQQKCAVDLRWSLNMVSRWQTLSEVSAQPSARARRTWSASTQTPTQASLFTEVYPSKLPAFCLPVTRPPHCYHPLGAYLACAGQWCTASIRPCQVPRRLHDELSHVRIRL